VRQPLLLTSGEETQTDLVRAANRKRWDGRRAAVEDLPSAGDEQVNVSPTATAQRPGEPSPRILRRRDRDEDEGNDVYSTGDQMIEGRDGPWVDDK